MLGAGLLVFSDLWRPLLLARFQLLLLFRWRLTNRLTRGRGSAAYTPATKSSAGAVSQPQQNQRATATAAPGPLNLTRDQILEAQRLQSQKGFEVGDH